MFFKILSRRQYQHMLGELERLRQQCHQMESHVGSLEEQKQELESRYNSETSALKDQLDALQQTAHDFELLQQRISEDIEDATKEIGISRAQIEKLWADQSDLIELYIDKLYLLAQNFSRANKEMRKNRGLFLLLVDCRNMVDDNFSEFYDGQVEHLAQSQYQGIEQMPHIFSQRINEVLSYMGEKVILKDESGEITGHEERDGALLIDLRGVAFRSRMMVEGVRTHRVYDRVERLQKGSAKHNAALYASSLDEVMASIVISEETSEVTLFRDGRFIKRYDPYTDTETVREEKIVPMKREESPVKALKGEDQQETTGSEDMEHESFLTSPTRLQSG